MKPRGRPPVKLTDNQVAAIRERRMAGDLCKEIATDFGTSCSYVSQIATGKRKSSNHLSVLEELRQRLDAANNEIERLRAQNL